MTLVQSQLSCGGGSVSKKKESPKKRYAAGPDDTVKIVSVSPISKTLDTDEREALLYSFFNSPGAMRGIVEIENNDIRHISDNVITAAFFGRTQESMINLLASQMGVERNIIDMWIERYEESKKSGQTVRFEYEHKTGAQNYYFSIAVNYIGESSRGHSRYTYVLFDITELKQTQKALQKAHDELDKRVERRTAELAESIKQLELEVEEHKLTEKKLSESECRLSFALEGANDGIWDVQMATDEVYLSPRACEILGYLPEEMAEVAQVWHQLVHPDDLPLTQERLQAHLEGRAKIFEVEQRLRMKSGEWKWVLARGKAVEKDAEGQVLRMTGTHTDISERKRSEEEREILQAQLVQSQKMESVGRLAGGVAHDFNNMLLIILGHAELALENMDSEHPLHHDLTQISHAANRSASLTRQLLGFARKQAVAPKVVDFNQTIEGTLDMLRRLVGEDINITWRPEQNLWPVKVDPVQIDQILANLCVNSRDAIEGTGDVFIETHNANFDETYCAFHPGTSPGDFVMLSFSDNGCGMSKDTIDRIFEPFFTTKKAGTGLGLATVYGIVKQNNGFICTYSELEYGSAFKIYLPRFTEKNVETPAEPPLKNPQGQGKLVLLVEDEAAILEMGKQMLERLGYRVIAAHTPNEALELAKANAAELDLLITDVIMPEMNGQALAQMLDDIKPGLKCLYMSGYTADVIAHHGVLDEGVNFLQKPFSIKDVAFKIHRALESEESQ